MQIDRFELRATLALSGASSRWRKKYLDKSKTGFLIFEKLNYPPIATNARLICGVPGACSKSIQAGASPSRYPFSAKRARPGTEFRLRLAYTARCRLAHAGEWNSRPRLPSRIFAAATCSVARRMAPARPAKCDMLRSQSFGKIWDRLDNCGDPNLSLQPARGVVSLKFHEGPICRCITGRSPAACPRAVRSLPSTSITPRSAVTSPTAARSASAASLSPAAPSSAAAS